MWVFISNRKIISQWIDLIYMNYNIIIKYIIAFDIQSLLIIMKNLPSLIRIWHSTNIRIIDYLFINFISIIIYVTYIKWLMQLIKFHISRQYQFINTTGICKSPNLIFLSFHLNQFYVVIVSNHHQYKYNCNKYLFFLVYIF